MPPSPLFHVWPGTEISGIPAIETLTSFTFALIKPGMKNKKPHETIIDVMLRFFSKLDVLIGPKWDRSGTFTDQYILALRDKMY